MKNIFDSSEGIQAIKRMNAYGKTNIRYSVIEKYGQEKVQEDLSEKVGTPCKVKICYENHEPMDLIKYFYCGDETFTVRIPIMPVVTIERIRKK